MTDISVLTSLAIREAYLELVPAFEAQTGHRVSTTWAGTVDIRKRMAAGESHDVVMMSADGLEALATSGIVDPATVVRMVRCGIGVGVPRGAPVPDISNSDRFRQALLHARCVGYSTGPSGVYLKTLFERLGVADAVAAKTCVVPSGATVASVLASGEADFGMQQVPELIHAEGTTYAGPLPDEIQHVTTFSGAVHHSARDAAAARGLLEFLTAVEAAPVMRRHGLEPS